MRSKPWALSRSLCLSSEKRALSPSPLDLEASPLHSEGVLQLVRVGGCLLAFIFIRTQGVQQLALQHVVQRLQAGVSLLSPSVRYALEGTFRATKKSSILCSFQKVCCPRGSLHPCWRWRCQTASILTCLWFPSQMENVCYILVLTSSSPRVSTSSFKYKKINIESSRSMIAFLYQRNFWYLWICLPKHQKHPYPSGLCFLLPCHQS